MLYRIEARKEVIDKLLREYPLAEALTHLDWKNIYMLCVLMDLGTIVGTLREDVAQLIRRIGGET